MDIERLSKSQIVMLSLLISFVTSIATGIVAVSLMDQAPPAIAQSVSRIIEKTILTVASSTPKGQAATTVVTQEKTVVVKESDLISKAVATAQSSIVRMYSGSDPTDPFIGFGVVLDGAGTIAADTTSLGDNADATLTLPDGARVRAFVVNRDSTSGIAYLKTATSTLDGKTATFTPIGISTTKVVLGETAVTLSGKSTSRIAAGLVTAIVHPEDGSPDVIDTDIAPQIILPGSPLIDTEGSLIGVSTAAARASSSSGFVLGSALMKAAVKK